MVTRAQPAALSKGRAPEAEQSNSKRAAKTKTRADDRSVHSEHENVEAQICSLESNFRDDNLKHINNLVDIIHLITPDHPHTPKAIHAARRIIVQLEDTPAETLQVWLSARRNQYAEALETIIVNAKQVPCLEAAVAAAALTHTDVWRIVAKVAIQSDVEYVARLLRDFVTRFSDLRLTTLELIAEAVGRIQTHLDLLSDCHVPATDVARKSVSQKDLRRAFTEAWLAVLREDLSPSALQQVLRRLPIELIPNMHDPLRLADFLTACYNDTANVAVAIMALDGLFFLISRHKLDYPLFYPKLYALMTEDALFRAEGRDKFLELTAAFLLRSSTLPGGMVAAFIKRLLRRALVAPPGGALWCLRLALDLLYKHPNTSYLVHRSVNLFESDVSAGSKRKRTDSSDPFDDDEPDPQESNASESSLWELQILAKHISPAVSRLVTTFSRDVRSNPAPPPGDLANYVGLDFSDIFLAETKRKARSSHLAYDAPGTAPGLSQVTNRVSAGISWT